MSAPYVISGEDPIELTGMIGGDGRFQLLHGSVDLDGHGLTVHAEHEDLTQRDGFVQVRLVGFTVSGVSWELSASHDPGGGVVNWQSGSGYAYHDFGVTTNEQVIDVVAESDESPPKKKTRRLKIKLSPTNPLFDRPPI